MDVRRLTFDCSLMIESSRRTTLALQVAFYASGCTHARDAVKCGITELRNSGITIDHAQLPRPTIDTCSVF